ncbi:MAG: hypothetical protein ABI920_18965, partial [Casimicrobiaceae bacterium]
ETGSDSTFQPVAVSRRDCPAGMRSGGDPERQPMVRPLVEERAVGFISPKCGKEGEILHTPRE